MMLISSLKAFSLSLSMVMYEVSAASACAVRSNSILESSVQVEIDGFNTHLIVQLDCVILSAG